MRIPATLELRGTWAWVTDPQRIEPTGVYVLAIAGREVEYLYIDGRYIGEVLGSMPSPEFIYEAHTNQPHALVTARTVHMMLHTHQEDDPRLRDEPE